MAHIATLDPAFDGLSEYLNVDAKVGADPGCANRRSDVEAVQRLLDLVLRGRPEARYGLPSPTGKFDSATGFYVFLAQRRIKMVHPRTVVDGCISPAKRVWYGTGIYTILHLNGIAKQRDLAAWQQLLAKYR